MKLILNADDFGLTESVNHGIVETSVEHIHWHLYLFKLVNQFKIL